MANKEKIIYVSGLIDGEGWIGIKKCSKASIRSLSPAYGAWLQVTNTNEEIIGWLIQNFGGHFCKSRATSIKHKTAFTWYIGNKKMYPLLKKVIPYLIIKQKQAKIILHYLENKKIHSGGRFGKLSNGEISFRENHYLFLRKLNHKGPLESVTTNTSDNSGNELKIESELNSNVKSLVGDNLTA